MSERLKWSYGKLENYSRTLEQKVGERTVELRTANTKLQEQDKVRTDFLSTVSHEIRTPLALVLGFVRIINMKLEKVIFPLINVDDEKAEKAKSQIKKNINIVKLEGFRLTALINDILDISKMEAGKVGWQMKNLSVAEIIGQAMDITDSFLEMYNLEIVEDVEDELPEVVGDMDKLKQVVINLISNAMKFTEEGPIICRARKGNGEIMISVIDKGIGVVEADQETIFEKFGQVQNGLKDKPKGTGLGLAICKEIVEHHNGRIWVESNRGKGSSFIFTLPCV
jgi:signal transduction histidine kinase